MEANNSREYTIQYETPIIIPRGSNKDNPFAEDKSSGGVSIGKIADNLFIFGYLLFIVYLIIAYGKAGANHEKLIAEFEKGSTLWCKPGYEFTSEVRINKSEGWEYVAHQEMFYNDKLGVTARFSTKLCR